MSAGVGVDDIQEIELFEQVLELMEFAQFAESESEFDLAVPEGTHHLNEFGDHYHEIVREVRESCGH